jgi:hypothetical protein
MSMRTATLAMAGILCATATFAPLATAEPTLGHFVTVQTRSPSMRCEVASDDSDGVGPNVVCQTAGFPQAPIDPAPDAAWRGDPSVLHKDQAIITASGQFSWRTANLGLAPPEHPDVILLAGTTYQIEGWTIVSTSDGITFTHDATRHGMSINGDYNVDSF